MFRRTLRIHSGENEVLTTGLLPPMAGLSRPLPSTSFFCNSVQSVLQPPRGKPLGLGLIPFRSPLLRESHCFLFLPVLRCSVPRVRLLMNIQGIQIWIPLHYIEWWVSPFGNLRIKGCLQLPEAYRCSSRPSSAPGAKASTVRPF